MNITIGLMLQMYGIGFRVCRLLLKYGDKKQKKS